jgi:hypothetical protein
VSGPVEAAVGPAHRRPEARARRRLLVLLAIAVGVQLVVLYAPEGVASPPFLQADKLAHALVFLVPVALAVAAGLRRGAVVAVFAAHAVLSEVVQAVLLPHRSGDAWDAVADLTGVALGVLAGGFLGRAVARRQAGLSAD